jgi:hypothetical protein
MRILALLCALLGASGCSNNSAPATYAKNYNRACASVADCVVVPDGPVGCCGGTDCPTAAINQNALAAYTRERAAMCLPPKSCAGISAAPCPQEGRLVCTGGLCEVLAPDADATD